MHKIAWLWIQGVSACPGLYGEYVFLARLEVSLQVQVHFGRVSSSAVEFRKITRDHLTGLIGVVKAN